MIFHLIIVTVITGMWTAVFAVIDLMLVSALRSFFLPDARALTVFH